MMEQSAINKITLRGTIIATRMTSKNRAIYTIATDGDKGKSEYPEVIHLIKSSEEVRCIGDNVTAICHARSGKKIGEDNKTVYLKQIVVDRITKSERLLNNYFDNLPDDGMTPEDINEFVFCGEVYRVVDKPGGRENVLVTLKIPDGKYNNYVEIAGFRKNADKMRKAKVGEYMAIAGSIRTQRKHQKNVFDYVAKDVYLYNNDESEE